MPLFFIVRVVLRCRQLARERFAKLRSDVLVKLELLDQKHGELLYLKITILSGFQLSVESNSHLLWFCVTTLSDWFKKLAPLSQPIRSKTKTAIVTRSHTFSRASCRLLVFSSSFDWFTGLSVSFVIGQSDYFWFWFYDTHLKTAIFLSCSM